MSDDEDIQVKVAQVNLETDKAYSLTIYNESTKDYDVVWVPKSLAHLEKKNGSTILTVPLWFAKKNYFLNKVVKGKRKDDSVWKD